MEFNVFQFCILQFYFTEVVSTCHQDPYPNFCGYNGNEYNASEFEDTEVNCDCQMVIFCSLISFARECNSTTVRLVINESTVPVTELNCNTSPLESQALIPTLEMLNSTGNELSVKLFANPLFGMYKFFCAAPDEFNKTFSNEWEIIDINPAEIFVDSKVKLQLTLNKAVERTTNSTLTWCFVNTPDNDREILSIMDISEDRITCAAFSPVIPGMFKVSFNYGFSPYTIVKVIGKHPVAQKAEYDSNFETMFIAFDANIKLHSTCSEIFPEISQKYFGSGFECYTRGNTLGIKMGSQFKVINNITINSDNKICREGYRHSEFCFSVLPANLIISKPKVSGPNLSFYTTDMCAGNKTQKFINLRVFNLNRETVPFQSQTLRTNSAGKTHRKNLIVWRSIRQIQSKLSSQLFLQMNRTDFLSLYENLSAFEIDFDADYNNSNSGASVSVYVQSSFANSPLLAEAHVAFCNDYTKLFRYKWLLNGKNVSEGGRLLTLSDLPPGKYLIKCLVVAYESTEVLGQGWATAEVFENVKEVLILPSEVAIGMADDIFLRAVTMHGNSASWTCRTDVGELCFARNQNLIGDAYDFTSSHISLPAGSLPLGDYIWTAESSGEAKTAKVSIKPGEVTVHVEISTAFVNPSLGFILNGSIHRVKERCYARWSSIRQKGFSYLDLDSVGAREILIEEHHSKVEIPLAIPPFSSALQASSLYLFRLQVFCPQSGSLRYIKVPVRTSVPPIVLPLTVEPLTGEAMVTNFRVSGAEADVSVQDYPLVFEWSYVDPCDTKIPLGRGLSARNFTTFLPPGDVKIMVRVCNGKEICSTSVSPTIAVIQPAEIHAENFDKTLNQIQYLMTSGDVGEALGLAVTMFKSLALTAEFEIRNKVFSVVEEAINMRIRDLEEKLHFDPNAMKLSLEFYEQTEMVAKYFHKDRWGRIKMTRKGGVVESGLVDECEKTENRTHLSKTAKASPQQDYFPTAIISKTLIIIIKM